MEEFNNVEFENQGRMANASNKVKNGEKKQ